MKKYMLLGTLIAIMPNYVFGASARYNQLVAEKQQKMAELEKCSGDVNGWKIAGISTIGLTAVGVAGNIVLANTQSKYDDKIANTNKEIDNTRNRIEQKERENAEKAAARERICRESGGTYLNGQCYCGADKVLNAEGRCQTVPQSTAPVQPVATPTQETKCIVNGTEYIDNNAYNVSAYQCSVFNNTLDLLNVRSCDCVCHDNVMNCTVATCFDKYKLENNKCVLEQQNNVSADCTSEAKAKDSNVVKAVKNGDKCEVTECVSTHKVKSDKTGCKLKESKKEPAKTNEEEKNKSCSVGYLQGQKYAEGTYTLDCAAQTGSRYLDNNLCQCTCKEAKWNCKEIQQSKKNNNGKIDINQNGKSQTYDVNTGNWTVEFDYGTVKGTSKCSNSEKGVDMPASTKGENCWCMVKSLPTKTGMYPWVWYKYENGCQYNGRCAYKCAEAVKFYPTVRQDMFGIY